MRYFSSLLGHNSACVHCVQRKFRDRCYVQLRYGHANVIIKLAKLANREK